MNVMKKTILPLVLAVSFATTSHAKDTGIWYSTLYAKEMKYTWATGHGSGSAAQFLADVDNDGDADAIAMFPTGGLAGKWYVAKSNGDGFGGWSQWASGHGIGSSAQLMADVTGDGRADAAVFFVSGSLAGNWYVATAKSSGGFDTFTQWKSGFGAGTSKQILGDVNGDGKADAIAYLNGKWDVALSGGSSFGTASTWRTGHGVGSADQLIADANGDGKSDAIAVFNSGKWYVAKANSGGTAFSGWSNWTDQSGATSLGASADKWMAEDIDDDGKADAIAYMGDGTWRMLLSNGTNFIKPASTYYIDASKLNWKVNHGHSNQRIPYSTTTWVGVGDVYGNDHAAPVVFRKSGGIWQAIPGVYHANQPTTSKDYYFKPAMVNGWENRNYGYVPVGGTYDSGDVSAINGHLSALDDADIDFILLDETNSLYNDKKAIIRRALTVCETVVSSSTGVKFAVAIGGWRFPTSDPISARVHKLESEAEDVWKLFLDGGVGTHEALEKCNGTAKYFNTTDASTKPLLAVYGNEAHRDAWEAYGGTKTYANKFNIKWVQGSVCTTGANGCNNDLGGRPASDFVGWAFTEGAIKNNDLMTFMPGWDNHVGSTPVSRDSANFYKEKGWERVVCDGTMPDMIVIASYNEYGEETAVAPSDTSALPLSKQWSSDGRYWDITKQFNAAYKSGSTAICSLFVNREPHVSGLAN